jgi:hypothetical protein
MLVQYPKTGHDRFFTHPSHFIIERHLAIPHYLIYVSQHHGENYMYVVLLEYVYPYTHILREHIL